MKRPSEMTPEELRALPEYRPYEAVCITSADMLAQYPGHRIGDTINVRKTPQYLAPETGPTAIAFWRDADGSWTPVQTSEGWFKQRFDI